MVVAAARWAEGGGRKKARQRLLHGGHVAAEDVHVAADLIHVAAELVDHTGQTLQGEGGAG